ncbi:MAG: glycosyl hydrolase [Bacteroidota bacterium]
MRFHTLALLRLSAAAILVSWSSSYGQYTNVRLSQPGTRPNEVTIAINPTNPLEIAAGSNPRYTYRSTDGGESWSQGELPPGTWGDPSVIYDAGGMLYYAHLAYLPGGEFADRLIVHRSADGGLTWSDSSEAGHNPPLRVQDKEWIAADATDSQYRNSLYMAWTEFDQYDSANPSDSTRIFSVWSIDGGGSWSDPVRVSEQAGDCLDSDGTVEGAVPAIGPGGEIYLSWSGPLGIMFDRSTNGGVTFGEDRFVTDQPGGWAFSIPGIFRCNGFPVTACDLSDSPYRGTVYIVWSDQRNGMDNTDVFLTKSTDGGTTWSPRRKVNDDMTVSHQFFPWMTIDQATGILYFIFYDRRGTTGNATDVYMARSTDGGETFQNSRVSESSFTPSAQVFIGDYNNIAAADGRVYPIWTRMDNGDLSVWIALVADPVGVGGGAQPTVPTSFALYQNYPNPFNPSTTIDFEIGFGEGNSSSIPVTLTVYDILGREVATLLNEKLGPGRHSVRFDAGGLAGGLYTYRLRASGESRDRIMVYLR